jgi:large subunit ribosomal protein L35
MPKLKTHKGAQKRFKLTGKKKIIYSKAFKNHILTKKSAKRKRNLSKPGEISPADRNRIKSMLPYGF